MRTTKSTFSVQQPLVAVTFIWGTSLQVFKIRKGGWYRVLPDGYHPTKEGHFITDRVQLNVIHINWSCNTS